ncbi:hypothetical protein F9U64_18730 [Gracilibacillus oryzae]|uniref:Uncharacterized protein n=1 Tax=Gracilibacillus oryzae TaxID=1672701 RepID=A0A7C8KX57_9BACI|nr:hypothetical protein [Gracilibacillus oryzae]KAB8127050.1 hypothetical protein F9U64_18730 [Gracilibacillus oryzae]
MQDKLIGKRLFLKEHGITSGQYSNAVKLVLGSVLGTIAALLQSAGLFAGFGYLFSMMATGPIVLATILSIKIGLITYTSTALLLLIIQPSEIVVFLFTTGLLGVGLGIGFKLLKKRILVTMTGAFSLVLGVIVLLYLFQFPILGPGVTGPPGLFIILGLSCFCLLYSWIWMRISLVMMVKLERQYSLRRSQA